MLALGLVADTSSAVADEPVKTDFTLAFSDVITNVCPFPVNVDAAISGFAIDHFDKDGVLTRSFNTFGRAGHVHRKRQEARGDTLRSQLQFRFDSNGNLISQIGTGIYEKVPLPDGSLFISAGRSDFVPMVVRSCCRPTRETQATSPRSVRRSLRNTNDRRDAGMASVAGDRP